MRQFSQMISVVVLFATFSLSASAQNSGGGNRTFYFGTSIFPEYVNRNDTSSFTTSPGVAAETGLGYDSRTSLGLVLGRSLVVGATYNLYHLQTKRSAIEGGDTGMDETTHTEQWGPMVGWLGGNWRFLATYFLSGKKTVDTKNFDTAETTGDVTITRTKMTGYQVEIGYSFFLSQNFALGPALVYRDISYSSQSKKNRINSSEDYEDVSLYTNSNESTLKALLNLSFQY